MNLTTHSYANIEYQLMAIADKFQPKATNKESPFKGHHFMTGNIIAERRLNNGVWFELSYGMFIRQSWLLGVTLIDSKGNYLETIQGGFREFSEVEEALQKASEI